MTRAIRAGGTYFALVFAVAFVLGAIRTGFIVPRTGAVIAVLIEAPILLGIAWVICRRVTRRFDVSATVPARLVMGLVAFTLLMLAELALSVLLAGRSPAQHLALYRGLPEQVGLAAQILFALLPAIQPRVSE